MTTQEPMPSRVKIASELRKAIYAGEYKSGDELSLTGVSEKMNVSRTPVREAFQELAADGLITLRMNRGAIVNGIDEKFIRDQYEMRMLLESEAAYKAALAYPVTGKPDAPALLTRLYHQRDNMKFVTKEEYEALNMDIHMQIWDAADNQKLKSFLLDLWNGPSTRSDATSVAKHYEQSTEEHIELMGAIRRGDGEKAREVMMEHIRRSMENML